jgi:cephalosporin hydroxylase
MYKDWVSLLRKLADAGQGFKSFWLGFKIAQLPEDLIAYQEIIFNVKPHMIIETGVLHGGTAIFFASMLQICGLNNSRVVGIDIKLRPKTKQKTNTHPLGKKITLLEGSSTSPNIVKKVFELARGKRVIVHLDSHHSYEHVLAELKAYAPLASYIIVADTGVEDIAPYGGYTKDNNPKVAVREFLKGNPNFKIDKELLSKLVMTSHPDGYLKRVIK